MGLLSLASAVKDLADVQLFDVNKQINAGALELDSSFYRDAAEMVAAGEPDLVGFMTDCDSFHHVIRICASLKVRRPGTIIVLGCVHASYNASEILSRYDFIDFIIRGEGEIAFRQFVETLVAAASLETVGNLSYRTLGEIGSTSELALIQSLDTLPVIDPELAGLEPSDALWIEIGRGCPFKCNFCVTAPYWHRRHRIKSPARILAELRFFRDTYGRRDFNFTHDLFTTDRKWVLRFSAALRQADLGVSWTCSSRTDTLDEEQLAAMAAAGCRDIYFGVETGTSKMQRAIDKGLGLTESRQVIELCHRYGVGTTIGFIAGLPGETPETLAGTVREATSYLRRSRTTVHLFGYGPYRGSSGFKAVEPDLVPETRFVDFPLSGIAGVENRALITAHRDVFARYSRLEAHRSQGFDRLLEVAEEYFPILNSVPQLACFLLDAGIDPYDQLCAWADWLQDRHLIEGRKGYDAHLGTIDEFLDFAREFAVSRGLADGRFADTLRWERMKQQFRSEAPGTETAVIPQTDEGSGLRVNPTLRMGAFDHVLGGATDRMPSGSYAFLRRRSGESSIVRVGPLARMIIELAEGFGGAGDLKSAIEMAATSDDAAKERLSEVVSATLDQLIANDIVFGETV